MAEITLTKKQDDIFYNLLMDTKLERGNAYHWDIGTPSMRHTLVEKGMIAYHKFANGETNRKAISLTDAGRDYAIAAGWIPAPTVNTESASAGDDAPVVDSGIPAPSTPCHVCSKPIGNTSVIDEHDHVYHPNCFHVQHNQRAADWERLTETISELQAENSALKAALEEIKKVGTERLSSAIARKALKALNATK